MSDSQTGPAHPPARSVAVITDFVFHYYAARLLAGVKSVLQDHGVPMTVYIGGPLVVGEQGYAQSSAIYSLIRPERHRGALLFSLPLSLRQEPDELLDLVARLAPLPVVSVGRSLPGVVSVEVDNRTGMQALMDHLVGTCGYTHLAFVRGQRGNNDSAERERIFTQTLRRHGLAVDERSFIDGEFSMLRAQEATLAYLESGVSPELQVLVCANDDMAEGVMRGVRAAGKRIPEDIAVVGFDDMELARTTLPPLTTVRQPVFQEGQLAARKLLSLLQGHSAEDLETLQSTLVVRESCGVEVRAPDRPVQAAATRREAPPAAHLSSPVREALEQAFRVSLLDEGNQDFLSLWRATVITAVHTEGGAGEWADFLNSLTERVRAELPDAPQERFGQLTLRATQMVLDGVHNLRVTLRSQEEQRSLRVARMFATRTSDDLFTAVGEYLDHLKVRRYILALYEPYSQAPAPSARVVLGQGTGVPVDRAPFPSSSLLPSSMASELQRGSVMVAPLYAGDLQFGYLLYDRPDALADEREGILRLYFDDETPLRMISHALLYQHERARTERHAAELEQQVHRRTEQLREANDHLQHSEGRFRSLVQNASDLIMVLDAHLRVLYVSPAVEVVFGHAAPAMLGQQVLDHLPADQHHGVREVVADLVSSGLGSNVRTEFQVLNAAREARWLEGRVTNLLTDPHVQGLVVNARDITEQIRTREALSVSQQQLMSSERLASLGRLTAGLAHEINTPLAATMNYLHVARGLVQEYQGSIGHAGVTDADHQEIASETLAALNEAGKTTARIGEFIRQMRGHTRDTVSGVGSFDPFKLASDTLTMVAHEARAAQVDLHLEFYPLPLRLRGEPGRFTQVLTNLVINAIHACEGRAGARRVDVRFLEQQGGVDLQVQDNGSGIAPEVIGHIFDAMFTTKEAGKGTGLGLAILHDIVHGHFGGTTEVQTEVGTGTVFTVRFPAREGAAQAG